MKELVWATSLLQSNDTTGNTVSVTLCYSKYELQSQKNIKQETFIGGIFVFNFSQFLSKSSLKKQVN